MYTNTNPMQSRTPSVSGAVCLNRVFLFPDTLFPSLSTYPIFPAADGIHEPSTFRFVCLSRDFFSPVDIISHPAAPTPSLLPRTESRALSAFQFVCVSRSFVVPPVDAVSHSAAPTPSLLLRTESRAQSAASHCRPDSSRSLG